MFAFKGLNNVLWSYPDKTLERVTFIYSSPRMTYIPIQTTLEKSRMNTFLSQE